MAQFVFISEIRVEYGDLFSEGLDFRKSNKPRDITKIKLSKKEKSSSRKSSIYLQSKCKIRLFYFVISQFISFDTTIETSELILK